MWDYFKSVNEILQAVIWGSIIVSMTAIVGAVIYRLVRYGIKIKAGVVEVDLDNDGSETKVESKNP